jgi:hypothetical protein
MIDSSPGHASVLTSLKAPASLGQDSFCLFTVLFRCGIFPLDALLTVVDDSLFFMEVCGYWYTG